MNTLTRRASIPHLLEFSTCVEASPLHPLSAIALVYDKQRYKAFLTANLSALQSTS